MSIDEPQRIFELENPTVEDYKSLLNQLVQAEGKDQYRIRSMAQEIWLKSDREWDLPWDILPKELREKHSKEEWSELAYLNRKGIFLNSRKIISRLESKRFNKKSKELSTDSISNRTIDELIYILNDDESISDNIPLIQKGSESNQLLREWREKGTTYGLLTGYSRSENRLYNGEYLSGLGDDEQPWGIFRLYAPGKVSYAYVAGRYGRSCSGCNYSTTYYDKIYIHQSLEIILRYALSEEERRQIGVNL